MQIPWRLNLKSHSNDKTLKMKNIFITLTLSIVAAGSLLAQVGTDTVVVKEDPLVYNVPLEVEDAQTAKFYLNGNVSVFNNYNGYKPCEGCDEFLEDYKSYVTPELNYSAGLSLLYAPKNWVLEAGVEYTQMTQKFSFTNGLDSTFESDNKQSYLDIKVTGGYWFLRDNKICSIILKGGLTYNRLLSASGLVNDFYNDNNVLELSSSGKLRDDQLSGMVAGMFIFLPQNRVKLSLEPYYMGSLSNITQKNYPYLELYNRLGVKAGVIFSL